MSAVATVVALARYPVKSLLGEQLHVADVDRRGLVGDRVWAVYTEDGGIGSGKTSSRFRHVKGLLGLRASLTGDVPELHLPDGRRLSADDPATGDDVSRLLGRPLTLRAETTVPHHDEAPVHLVTTAALRALAAELGGPVDPVRFRANLVLDVDGVGHPEDGWAGQHLVVGDEVALRVEGGMQRCVMVDAVQGVLPRDGRILTTLGRTHDVEFGAAATVVRGGRIRVGDVVQLHAST